MMTTKSQRNQETQTRTKARTKRVTAKQNIPLTCMEEMNCRMGMTCLDGTTCPDGVRNTPCDTRYYAPILDYQRAEKRLERRLIAIFGHLEPEEMAAAKELRARGLDALQEINIREARAKLEDVGRPLCRRDLLEAMDAAVLASVRAYKGAHNMMNASLLLATDLCREMLADAAISETEGGEPHSA